MLRIWKRLSFRSKVATVVGVAAAVCVGLFLAPEKASFRSSALFARDAYAKESHVDVSARLDRNIVDRGDTGILEVNVQNNNPEPLQDFHVSITAPGFEWSPQQAAKELSGMVPAGSSRNASIPLRALAKSGIYNISVFYSWNNKSRYSSAISLGPLKMSGLFSEEHWSRFLARSSQLIKDLTLPIVLAVLGYYFQLRQSVRDAKRQQLERRDELRRLNAEDARDQQRQREEKTRDERQQVRQNILPLVMSLAERHYMPIVTSARLLILHHKNLTEKVPGSSIDEVFFDALFLLKRMDYLRRDKGQIFFQDNAAEALAADAWFVLKEKLRTTLGDAQIELALQKIGNDDRFAEFAARRYQRQFEPAFNGFRSWMANDPDEFQRYLKLADIIQAVFRYEANRPFLDHWYGGPKKLRFDTDCSGFPEDPDLPRTPVNRTCEAKIKELRKEWPLYLAATELT